MPHSLDKLAALTDPSAARNPGGKPVNSKILFAALSGALVVSGCSSTPRAFAPTLTVPPPDQRALDQATADCSALYVAGKLDQNGRLASAGGAAGAGATAAAVGGATAAAVAGYGGLAVAAATIVLLPFAVVGGAVGMAKVKRAKKEKAIKIALAGCLKERGYDVTGWERLSKADAARARAMATAATAPATAQPSSSQAEEVSGSND